MRRARLCALFVLAHFFTLSPQGAVLRKVSRGLRSVVDQQRSILKDIYIHCHVDHIYAGFNHHEVVYADPKFDLIGFERYEGTKIIRSEDYLKVALDDLEFALKGHKLQLNYFSVEFHSVFEWGKALHDHLDSFSQKLEAILKSLNHQVSTKFFEFRAVSANNILSILPYLEPKTLWYISFDQYQEEWSISDAKFAEIAELDQWKQATVLGLCYATEMWPEKHLMHFKGFKIVDEYLMTEAIQKWRAFFCKSRNFIAGELRGTFISSPLYIQNEIGGGNPVRETNSPLNRPRTASPEIQKLCDMLEARPSYVINYPIPDDPRQYLEITVQPNSDTIIFKKFSRQSS